MPACAYCRKPFTSRHPSQRFCPKSNGRHLCKDRFHNTARAQADTITDDRRDFLADEPQQFTGFGPWDEHKDD